MGEITKIERVRYKERHSEKYKDREQIVKLNSGKLYKFRPGG